MRPTLRLLRAMYKNAATAGNKSKMSTPLVLDMRSDVLTQPCQQQRQAMAQAEVGDDVFLEDPTVNKLESYCAKLFGTEAALYVTSGCMGNLLSIMSHCSQRRDCEMIVGRKQHICKYEQGSFARFIGVSSLIVPNEQDGTIALSVIEDAVRDHSDIHQPKTEVVCLENTHNVCGGTVLPVEYFKQVRTLADRYGLKVHLDGARLMNAAVAVNRPVSDWVQYCDSVSFCLSKSIGAPIGSVIGGTRDFIDEARRCRKALGGGWRQAGHLAAAALVALDTATQRLTIDRDRTEKFAEGVNALKCAKFKVDPVPQSNIIMVITDGVDAQKVVDMLEDPSTGAVVRGFAFSSTGLRLVMHSSLPEQVVKEGIKKFAIVADALNEQ